MVKRQKKDNVKRAVNQGQNQGQEKAAKISPYTSYEYCSERLSPFGGLLALTKFLDAVKFQELFEGFYQPPDAHRHKGTIKRYAGYWSCSSSDFHGCGIFCIFVPIPWSARCSESSSFRMPRPIGAT